ncbi:MAG: type II/IV secretion system protein [Planctomycetes bacterium]|nr:type II/IV secretion system protein [Planctomycetota bacterium]
MSGQRAGEVEIEAAAALSADRVSASFLLRVPRDFARRHVLVSQGREHDAETLLVSRKTSQAVIHNVGVTLGCRVQALTGDPESIVRLIDQVYAAPGKAVDVEPQAPAAPESVDELIARADRDLLSSEGKGPIIQLVDALLFEALGRAASDLHVQPLDDRTIVRYRLDGMLVTVRELPRSLTPAVVSRIKVMGRMDVAESRVPQDGRATVTIGTRAIDLRISTLPTSYGERAVLRLLDNRQALSDYADLGMPAHVSSRFLSAATRSHGMILLTGPTGSGKTTTLYATLRQVGAGTKNLMTIEDPIEYELSTVGLNVSQSQVNVKKGLSFASGLRHILRQDPDVIMVGEIRDAETARIALQSSLTGHLVLSTLHTNDAPSAVTRLVDLGLEPYLVSASLSAVCAQRLVRLTHGACAGLGCAACFQTGFQGRTALFELMVVDDAIRERIAAVAPLEEIRQAARGSGMRSLREEGLDLVAAGRTTRGEIERVVQEET